MIKEFKDFGKSSTADAIATRYKDQYWKRILIVDDDPDITTTFKIGIENNISTNTSKRVEVHTYNDPKAALLDFEPNFYDLLIIDITLTDSSYLEGFWKLISMLKSVSCLQEK